MTTETYEAALDRAARICGVETRFWDIFGHERVASPEARQALLQALGIDVSSAESIDAALEERERKEWTRVLSPSYVCTQSAGPLCLSIRLPLSELQNSAQFRLTLESGRQLHATLDLSRLSIEERKDIGLAWNRVVWVRVNAELQWEIPLGYHDLEIEVGAHRASARLIIAPAAAWQPEFLQHGGKTSGFNVALYGLRSARNWGFGDFTDLNHLSTWAARELGVSFVGVNPLHSIHNRRPYNTSPYLPNSIFFQNCLYVDVERVEEWTSCARAQACFRRAETQRELHLLREAPEVEYERVSAIKTRFLKLLFLEFLRSHWHRDSERARAFQAYRNQAGDLLARFGLYCALDEHLRGRDPDVWIWTDWPEEYRDPESPQTRAFAKKHWRSVLFYQYAAWQTATQLEAAQKHAVHAGLALGLYHDLALATDRFGADIWAWRGMFASGCRVGSPPDDFSPLGQDWGFPPPNTRALREDGYHFFRESIQRCCQHGGALRIDHVMRLFRLYWIPDGMNASQGAYVRDRAEDLIRILALESVRNQVLIVGEDLGTVEPYIREMLANFGILSYRLFFFERHGDGSYKLPHEYPRQALVSATTHDLPTLAGFWKGSDIEARRAAGVLDDNGHRAQWEDRTREKQRMLDALSRANLLPHEYPRDAQVLPELDGVLRDAAIAFLASTPAMLMLVNQEDLTGEIYQQNLPGTTAQYPNWARKMRFTLEQLDHDPEARMLTQRLKQDIQANSSR